ncbi:MAG: hypothetical protein WA004_17260 [Saprospiraceae bacterium]
MPTPLNLFYQEPDPDRWFKYDRYPRRIIRRIVRGIPRPGGQQMVFINLVKGLDKLGYPYRVNDFRHAKKHPEELACIIGKPHVLYERRWENPVLFGASVFSHPLDCPDLFEKYPVKKILVPGEWMRKMFEPYYGDKVVAWPVGIDTEYWRPSEDPKDLDFLIYYKIRWENAHYDKTLFQPICTELEKRNLKFQVIRYGNYTPDQLMQLSGRSRAVIFLCEHETQGLAYQQLLSRNIPLFAWDRGGFWQDPVYYPNQVQFGQGVSSVPYWDERCGMTFKNFDEFSLKLFGFIDRLKTFSPRPYILENLTLEICAQKYIDIVEDLHSQAI